MGREARNTGGEMVPIGAVASLQEATNPYHIPRYNLYPVAEVQGLAAPGVATGTALKRMETLAAEVLPPGKVGVFCRVAGPADAPVVLLPHLATQLAEPAS